ncbi:hypothetical protein ASF58_19635 [Methylobacterium sp. Leaf125]|nr:hypothetical protein ASF58_19635 [Methylobacterium sp. Leaf125]
MTRGSAPSAKIISRTMSAANSHEISFEDTGTFCGDLPGRAELSAPTILAGQKERSFQRRRPLELTLLS